jgi:CubicO group peptidase (beta-lactamase class C family)
MRKQSLFAAIAIILLSIVSCTAPVEDAALDGKSADERAIAERIQQVEIGLLPWTIIEGVNDTPRTIETEMARLNVPSVSLALINDGAIEWTKAYGAIAADGSEANTETLFQAASISKPLAATAVMSLVQEGALDLDHNVNDYLENWQLPENELTANNPVTLRRLLSHTAGTSVSGFPGYASSDAVPTVQQILDGETPANTDAIRVNITPGSAYRYSGGGYTIAQQLLEDVSGVDFPTLLQQRVFEPAGMKHSAFSQPLAEEYQANAARAHDAEGNTIEGNWHAYPELAAAGMWTTPTDLATFALTVRAAYLGDDESILTQVSAKEMLTEVKQRYGLGVSVMHESAQKIIAHGGGNEGFRCIMWLYTDSGDGAVIMTNAGNGSILYKEIITSIAAVYDWPDFSPDRHTLYVLTAEQLAAFTGRYDLGESVADISAQEDHMLIRFDGQMRRLYPISETAFISLQTGNRVTFVLGEDGKARAIDIADMGQMPRIGDVEGP